MNEQDFRMPFHSMVRKDHGPMVLNSTSHPSYAPVKANVKTAADVKLSKSRAPEKPIAPYMRYSKKVWDQVKSQYPDAKLWEIGKIVGNMWRELNEPEKQEYIAEYEHAKAEYCEQLKAYHNSPHYQNFLTNASKKRDAKGGMNSQVLMSSNIINTLNNNNRVAGIADNGLSHYAIEPAEDDGLDENLTMRQIALSRYSRNHRLLNEIFNEYTVADNRSIITNQRIEQLKKQVTSLEMHQKKLSDELDSIEEKFEAKKKKINDSTNEFNNELEKLNNFKVTDDQLKTFYTKHYEQLEKQWDDLVEKIQKTPNNENSAEGFKMSLENLISNNKALMTIPAPSSVNLIALQQVVETPSAPQQVAATPPQPQTQPASTTSTNSSSNLPTGTPHTAQQAPNVTPQQQGAHSHQAAGSQSVPNQHMFNHHQQQQMIHQQQQMMHAQQSTPPHGPHSAQYHGPVQAPVQQASTPGPAQSQTTPSQQNSQTPTPQQPSHPTPPQIPQQPHGMPGQYPIPHQGQQPHLSGQTMPQQPPQAGSTEYPGFNQSQPGHQGYPPNQGYPQQPMGMQQPQNSMYPGQPPMYPQHQYAMQQQYQMQRPQGSYMGPQGAPGQQPTQQQMMGMNRPPVNGQMPNGQSNQQYPYLMGQPQFNQQQFRSTNTPPTNPMTNMASPVQQPAAVASAQATPANPNSGTPASNQPATNPNQSPIVNRIQPQQANPQQQQQSQIRHPSQPQQPGTSGNMNFYNGQMPMSQQQPHMYGMPQPHYAGQPPQQQQHPNMMQQQAQPYPQPVPTGGNPVPGPNPQQQHPNMMQQPHQVPPNMMYPGAPPQQGNMPYAMPPNMTPQQAMMMQQQQHPMMNNQYGMYQGVPQPGQQTGMPPQQQPQPQVPQINNSSPSQNQSPANATSGQATETKSKGKKKEKKSKAASAVAEST